MLLQFHRTNPGKRAGPDQLLTVRGNDPGKNPTVVTKEDVDRTKAEREGLVASHTSSQLLPNQPQEEEGEKIPEKEEEDPEADELAVAQLIR